MHGSHGELPPKERIVAVDAHVAHHQIRHAIAAHVTGSDAVPEIPVVGGPVDEHVGRRD